MATATAPAPKPRKPRRPAKPTHGTCSLRLTINGARYSVMPLPTDDGESFGLIRGFRLRSLAPAKGDAPAALYDVARTLSGLECDCADHTFHRAGLDNGRCKHVAALVALGVL